MNLQSKSIFALGEKKEECIREKGVLRDVFGTIEAHFEGDWISVEREKAGRGGKKCWDLTASWKRNRQSREQRKEEGGLISMRWQKNNYLEQDN